MGPRRAAARLSGGSTSFDRNGDDSFSSQRRASRRSSIDRNDDRTVAAERPLDRSSYRSRATHSPSHSPGRSPTPSPILGSRFAAQPLSLGAEDDDDENDHDVLKLGHLSFPMLGVGVGPTKDEIEMLVYGSTSANKDSADPSSPMEESGSVESILGSLANMGLDQAAESSASERERELAGMVKLLASRCTTLTESRDRAQSQLKSTRLTALSVISSMKQAHAHALAAHRNVTDRLEAELDGWKAQAKMLSALLTRAEARGFDERRSSTNSAPLVTFADKVKAAASGSSPNHNRVSSFKTDPTNANTDTNQRLLASPSFLSSSHDVVSSERSPGTTGLGISSSGLAEVDTDISPAASLLRERNKLITDKKHLKARVRDAEAQVYKLENELKSLRPYLVSGGVKATDMPAGPMNAEPQTPGGDISQPGTAPTTPSRSGSRRDKNRKKRNVTMGDAETEHLMLAARRLRELRKEQAAAAAAASGVSTEPSSLPVSQESNKSTSGTAPNGVALAPSADLHGPTSHTSPVKRQASEGPMIGDRDAAYPGEPRTPPSRSAERPQKTPKSIVGGPTTPRTGVRARELDELARGEDRRDSWAERHHRLDSASSFTGIDELLQAAETLNPARLLLRLPFARGAQHHPSHLPVAILPSTPESLRIAEWATHRRCPSRLSAVPNSIRTPTMQDRTRSNRALSAWHMKAPSVAECHLQPSTLSRTGLPSSAIVSLATEHRPKALILSRRVGLIRTMLRAVHPVPVAVRSSARSTCSQTRPLPVKILRREAISLASMKVSAQSVASAVMMRWLSMAKAEGSLSHDSHLREPTMARARQMARKDHLVPAKARVLAATRIPRSGCHTFDGHLRRTPNFELPSKSTVNGGNSSRVPSVHDRIISVDSDTC